MSESETMFTFDAWRRYLEFDANQVGMRETVKVMPDATLGSLWRAGIQPTVPAVIRIANRRGRQMPESLANSKY